MYFKIGNMIYSVEYIKGVFDSLLTLVKHEWNDEDYNVVAALVEDFKTHYGIERL